MLRAALLALPPLHGGFGKDNIAPALLKAIDYSNIGNELGAFRMDNASNNDTALEVLLRQYPINIVDQRLRCFGHVIHLVVKALLTGEGLPRFQKDFAGANDIGQFKLWRKQGAIGKLYNLIVFLMRSDKRMQVFNAIQQEVADDLMHFCLKLKRGTGVRWYSVFTMVERA